MPNVTALAYGTKSFSKNKPNGQYQMEFSREAVMDFMHDLPIRKVPGIGRVGEKVMHALGVKVHSPSILLHIVSNFRRRHVEILQRYELSFT